MFLFLHQISAYIQGTQLSSSNRPFDSFSGTQREEGAVLWPGAARTGILRTKIGIRVNSISGSQF